MTGLIKFELINLFKGISFYVCLASILVMSVVSVGVRALSDVFLYSTDLANLTTLGYSGQMFLLQSPAQSDFTLLIGILATIAVCTGYSQKTYRNMWGRGFSRGQVFAAKCISISVASAVYAVASMILGFLVAAPIWGVGSQWDINVILAFLLQILICIGIGLMYVAISFIFKKTPICIVIAVMTPSMLTIGSTVIDYICEYKQLAFRISPYILSNTLYSVAVEFNDITVLAKAFLCFAVYFVSAIVMGYFGMYKDEI